ncbi:MAG: porin [Comamonadaceae bacterium]|nr:MAG: porin [Comamonadaceae bacterium]
MRGQRAAALAALAVAGVASAQSSVTLFGTVDASISGVSNKSSLVTPNFLAPGSITTSKTGLNNSAYDSSRLGFRGVEDLGGGLAASFHLEGAVSNDDGGSGSNFQRRSTVSLSGNFGEVRLGRDYKPSFWNFTVFSPFGTNGAGTNLIHRALVGERPEGAGLVRSSNSIGYFLPKNLGGFYGQVQYAFHEKAKIDPGQGVLNAASNDSRGGRYWGGRFGYANGPLDVALAYGEANLGSNFLAGEDQTAKNLNFGASYDFGVVKLFGQYARVIDRIERSGSAVGLSPRSKFDGYLLGLTAPVGAGVVKASYGYVRQNNDFVQVKPKASQLAVGYVHNLSKRTALYTTVAYIRNKNGADLTADAGNVTASFATPTTFGGVATDYRAKTSIGYDVGIRHSF